MCSGQFGIKSVTLFLSGISHRPPSVLSVSSTPIPVHHQASPAEQNSIDRSIGFSQPVPASHPASRQAQPSNSGIAHPPSSSHPAASKLQPSSSRGACAVQSPLTRGPWSAQLVGDGSVVWIVRCRSARGPGCGLFWQERGLSFGKDKAESWGAFPAGSAQYNRRTIRFSLKGHRKVRRHWWKRSRSRTTELVLIGSLL